MKVEELFQIPFHHTFAYEVKDKNLQVLELCSKTLRTKLLEKSPVIRDLTLFTNPNFENMSKPNRYELWKNTLIDAFNKLDSAHNKVELMTIFNYFDLLIYQDRVVDLCPGKDFLEPSSFAYNKNDITKISCPQDFEDCVKLIVEDRKIYVKPFVLTDNSPVFKAMLQSTSFKEGQTKTIELPGKSLDEIVYFIKYIQFPNLPIDSEYLKFISNCFQANFYYSFICH